MALTHHASVRAQQRGIPPLIVEWLLEYGAQAKGSDGAMHRYFDKRSRKRLARVVGEQVVDRMGDLTDTFLVQSSDNGNVITVGHR